MNALSRAGRAFLLGCLLAAAVPLAQADVTTEQRISIEGIGGMTFANLSGTTTTIISGDRSRTESNIQMQSALLRMMARNNAGQRVEIVRLDRGTIDRLNVPKKEYTEETFEAMRQQMQQLAARAGTGAGGGDAQQNQNPGGIDDSHCAWSDPKVEAKRTGETSTIAGFEAERLSLRASQACSDPQTGQVCEFVLTLDQWLAPKFQSSGEALKYQQAYAQALGLGTTATTSRDIAERAQAMFGRYKGIWSELAAKTAEMKGYPMKTSFSLAIGGPQCKSTQNTQSSAQGSPSSSPSGQSSGDASANQNSGSSAPPTSPGEAAAQIGNKLAGFFKKNASPSSSGSDSSAQSSGGGSGSAPAAQAAPAPGGYIPVITMSSELVSVSTATVDPGLFEIPAGFTKVAR
jgi:hypothetical protein